MAKKKDDVQEPNMRERTHERVDTMMDKAESMQASGMERMRQLKKKAIASKESVDGYIRTNPGKSVLIAAGVGAVAGATITASMMRKRSAET